MGVGDPLSVLDLGRAVRVEAVQRVPKDFNISDDDSWGNEEQQARMGATTTFCAACIRSSPSASYYHLYSDKHHRQIYTALRIAPGCLLMRNERLLKMHWVYLMGHIFMVVRT